MDSSILHSTRLCGVYLTTHHSLQFAEILDRDGKCQDCIGGEGEILKEEEFMELEKLVFLVEFVIGAIFVAFIVVVVDFGWGRHGSRRDHQLSLFPWQMFHCLVSSTNTAFSPVTNIL